MPGQTRRAFGQARDSLRSSVASASLSVRRGSTAYSELSTAPDDLEDDDDTGGGGDGPELGDAPAAACVGDAGAGLQDLARNANDQRSNEVDGEREQRDSGADSWQCGNPVARIPQFYRSIVYRLLLFGFLHQFKPSEAFLTPYLTDVKGFPADPDVNNDIYPVYSYAYFAFIVPVAVLAEVSSYNVVIVVEGLAQLGTRVLLLWGETLVLMQLMQVRFVWFCPSVSAWLLFGNRSAVDARPESAPPPPSVSLTAGHVWPG